MTEHDEALERVAGILMGRVNAPESVIYDAARAAVEAISAGAEPVAWDYQMRVVAGTQPIFHDDPTDVAERRNRFAEEANETCQALGMTAAEAHALVDYTYGRPVGDPSKEIGSTMLTLALLAHEAGYSLSACAEADLASMSRPETVAKIRAKRAARHGRGPLPGLSSHPTPEATDV